MMNYPINLFDDVVWLKQAESLARIEDFQSSKEVLGNLARD